MIDLELLLFTSEWHGTVILERRSDASYSPLLSGFKHEALLLVCAVAKNDIATIVEEAPGRSLCKTWSSQ